MRASPGLLFILVSLLASCVAGADLSFAARIEDLLASQPASLTNSSTLIWQPLRASFRPLNRQALPIQPTPSSQPLIPPQPANDADRADEPVSLVVTHRAQPLEPTPSPISDATSNSATRITTTSDPNEEELPTRVPTNRFRPTRAPSADAQPGSLLAASSSIQSAPVNISQYHISQECFECICEATTNCNLNSRCQTSDVRHTRCGMFLISYDQWLETGLSQQLVTREALARDPAADERAFYECVTERSCAERLMSLYMQRRGFDCDKDGRLDCYDVAAIHQGGLDHCSGESLLDSQYWTDFNACFGFGR